VKSLVIFLLMAVAFKPAAAQRIMSAISKCSLAEVTAAAEQVDAARKQLLRFPVGEYQTDVSPAVRRGIQSMQSSLGRFVGAYMKCIATPIDPGQIQKQLSERVHAFQLPAGSLRNDQLPPDFGKYGFELWFEVTIAPEQQLIAVKTGFTIACGSDSMLMVFAPEEKSWREVLRWQSQPYKTIAGAFEAFDYGISPPDESGHWYVVAHSIMPWCSSTWSTIRYAVLRPGSDPLKPRVLLSRSEGMWWGNEDFGKVVVSRDSFDLRFHSNSIDSNVHNRVWIRHYAVSGDEVRRTQPVAVSPRDFTDEWIVSPWREASAWSSRQSWEQLQQMHRRLHKLRLGFDFDSVQKCPEMPSTVQVSVIAENEDTFYFKIIGNGPFQMKSVSTSPDSTCRSENILDTMATD
jgi:hypothetical protein